MFSLHVILLTLLMLLLHSSESQEFINSEKRFLILGSEFLCLLSKDSLSFVVLKLECFSALSNQLASYEEEGFMPIFLLQKLGVSLPTIFFELSWVVNLSPSPARVESCFRDFSEDLCIIGNLCFFTIGGLESLCTQVWGGLFSSKSSKVNLGSFILF